MVLAALRTKMKSTLTSRRRSGFTLLEILITVTVISILASIAVPAYTGSVNKSRAAVAMADIKYVEQALEKYLTNHNDFPGTLADADLSPVDPWGNPYQYLRMSDAKVGQVRKDKSQHPLNTDYDLYSMGADGKSVTPLTAKPSQDDIIRANNGGFIGFASDY